MFYNYCTNNVPVNCYHMSLVIIFNIVLKHIKVINVPQANNISHFQQSTMDASKKHELSDGVLHSLEVFK